MPDALRIKLSKEEIRTIQAAGTFTPLFPVNFLFNFRGDQDYDLSLTAANNEQYQMSAWIDAPPKQPVSELPRRFLFIVVLLTSLYSLTSLISTRMSSIFGMLSCEQSSKTRVLLYQKNILEDTWSTKAYNLLSFSSA
jgi:hypothetical protein